MIADHGSPSWKLKFIVAEVGCRGYIPPSFRKALQLFGFTSKEMKTLVDECSLSSRRSNSGSTVFIKLSFHFRWFKWTLNLINPLLWCELLWWCPSHTFLFLCFMFFNFMFCSLSLSLPPPSFFFFFFLLFYFLIYLFSILLVDFQVVSV